MQLNFIALVSLVLTRRIMAPVNAYGLPMGQEYGAPMQECGPGQVQIDRPISSTAAACQQAATTWYDLVVIQLNATSTNSDPTFMDRQMKYAAYGLGMANQACLGGDLGNLGGDQGEGHGDHGVEIQEGGSQGGCNHGQGQGQSQYQGGGEGHSQGADQNQAGQSQQ